MHKICFVKLPDIQLEQRVQPDGTIDLDVQDRALGHLGRIVILAAADGTTHVQVQLDVVEDSSSEQRVARMTSVAHEVAALFEKDIVPNKRH